MQIESLFKEQNDSNGESVVGVMLSGLLRNFCFRDSREKEHYLISTCHGFLPSSREQGGKHTPLEKQIDIVAEIIAQGCSRCNYCEEASLPQMLQQEGSTIMYADRESKRSFGIACRALDLSALPLHTLRRSVLLLQRTG